jgi:hypothetical protein
MTWPLRIRRHYRRRVLAQRLAEELLSALPGTRTLRYAVMRDDGGPYCLQLRGYDAGGELIGFYRLPLREQTRAEAKAEGLALGRLAAGWVQRYAAKRDT